MPQASSDFLSSVQTKLSAALVGFAALFTAGAHADIADHKRAEAVKDGTRPASRELARVLLRKDGERVYFSEDGTAYRELALHDTPDGASLKKLLNEMDLGPEAISVPVGRMIVADGGAGVHAPRQADRPKKNEQRSAEGK